MTQRIIDIKSKLT